MSKNARNWRQALSPKEREQLGRLDKQIKNLYTRLMLLRARRMRIQNTASVRVGR
jgi:archaellum biogenesis protein FlaJ (TadC family)